MTAKAISSNQVTLTWSDASTDESGFRIERSEDGTTFPDSAMALGLSLTFGESGVLGG